MFVEKKRLCIKSINNSADMKRKLQVSLKSSLKVDSRRQSSFWIGLRDLAGRKDHARFIRDVQHLDAKFPTT